MKCFHGKEEGEAWRGGGLTFDVLGSDRPLHVTLLHSQNILTHPSQMKYITGKQNICEGRGRAYLIFVISFTQAGFSNSKFYT